MAETGNGMADVFVVWAGRPADDRRSVLEVREAGCFELHGLHWEESFIAAEGRRRICHYRAPDAESVRIAFRQGGVPVESVWAGTVHDMLPPDSDPVAGNVVMEWAFPRPLPESPGIAVRLAQSELLIPEGLRLLRAVVSRDRERIVCLCQTAAEAAGGWPRRPHAASAWPCHRVSAGG
ncbi:MAG TPA: nickel-binding protein [Woeseiaceae bacterium]|nr:nickel-binding protein [Woeseiaceae bacterium]